MTLSAKETQQLLGADDPIPVVRCPYCGALTLATQVEQPVDYCHHDVIPDPAGLLAASLAQNHPPLGHQT
jgi:hypothetical protein